jgi:hypothetical protein
MMHMDIHVYEHVTCATCGKQFNSRTAMYKHNRVVHLGKYRERLCSLFVAIAMLRIQVH